MPGWLATDFHNSLHLIRPDDVVIRVLARGLRPLRNDGRPQQILTIGHSTHGFEELLSLLKTHSVSAICDVRSAPYSRMNPQFNRESFAEQLRENGIAYIYLGMELGGRTEDPACYEGKRVRYDRLAQKDVFQNGLRRVVEDSANYRLCLLCAEKEPLECHRTLLVSRYLVEMGLDVHHILADGTLESHDSVMERLLEQLKLPSHDLFRTHQEVIKDAYRAQGRAIAHLNESDASSVVF